jgi:hypothetical protein
MSISILALNLVRRLHGTFFLEKWGKWHGPYFMSDDGGGFKAWVAEDHPTSRRLKCCQHIGSKYLPDPNLIQKNVS